MAKTSHGKVFETRHMKINFNKKAKKSKMSNKEIQETQEEQGSQTPEINSGEGHQELVDDPIASLTSELEETRDKLLRAYSEFENYKKRTLKERVDLLKSANSEVIISLLPVLDDFERALKAMEQSGEDTAKEGVNLIYQKLFSILASKGLQKIESVGKDFNVDFHEAITNFPAANENQKGKVLDESESGYMLNGKVIRHAKVIVAG
jgi:molecular chaperone GrpE